MKLLRPFAVTDANLTSNVAETDASEYASTATYAAGATAMWTVGTGATHHVYESIVSGNVGNALTDTSKWLDLGPTNRFAMFDQKNGTSTTNATIDVSVDVTGRADGLALLGLDGEQVYVAMAVDGASRTNLCLYSEQINNVSGWANNAASVTANAVLAPNGSTTADMLVPDGTLATHGTYSVIMGQGAGTFTFSFYAKDAGYPFIGMRVYDGSAYQIRATFDLSTGTVYSTEAGSTSITDVGGGWYRCEGTGTTTGSMGSTVGWNIESLPAGVTVQNAFSGDGISGAYIWGAQIEAGGAATSYLQTTSAAVTSSTETVFEQTYNLQEDAAITSWYAYFTEDIVYKTDLVLPDLPLYTSPVVRVVITGDGSVSCGSMVLGQTRELGLTLYGARAGINDYSKKETDDFGNYTIVERAFAKRTVLKLVTENVNIDSLYTLLAAYRVTPAVWIGTDDYACTWVFGFYRSFDVEIAMMEKSYITLEIEGLT